MEEGQELSSLLVVQPPHDMDLIHVALQDGHANCENELELCNDCQRRPGGHRQAGPSHVAD